MASSPFLSLVSIFFFFFLILSFFNYASFSLRVDLSSSSSSSSNLEREGEGRQMKRRVAAETSEVWCVAKNNAEDTALQSGLDWVCGLGGADCGPIQQSGACYEPNNIQALASYAFNDYFHKNILDPQACVFGNTAALTVLNPSHGKCVFPSSFLARNGSFTGSATGANGMGSSAGDLSGSYRACRWAQSLVAVIMMLSSALIL